MFVYILFEMEGEWDDFKVRCCGVFDSKEKIINSLKQWFESSLQEEWALGDKDTCDDIDSNIQFDEKNEYLRSDYYNWRFKIKRVELNEFIEDPEYFNCSSDWL